MKKLLSLFIAMLFVFSALAPAALANDADRDGIFTQAMALLFPDEGSYEPQAALELLLPLAESGDAQAQYYCGWIYDFELEENMETELAAYEWYVQAVEGGVLKACVGAALNSFAESGAKSAELLDHAFSQGFLDQSGEELGADGLYWIAFMHNMGLGLDRDEEKALDYYTRAAEMNSIQGMKAAAYLALEKQLNKSMRDFAIEMYEKAAGKNDSGSMYSLAQLYYFSYPFEPDYELALSWFNTAAEQGHAESMYWLGMMYQAGEGTQADSKQAFEWYSRAVELGNTDAMCMLGHMYRDGEYVEKDADTAMNYFIDAAVRGNISAPYVVELMTMYNEGMDAYHAREAEYLAAIAG